jgi:hypothetical protein
MLVAFAIAIAVHEILAGLIPSPFPRNPASNEVVSHVTIGRIVVRSTPTPRPKPTPRVVSHARAIAPAETRTVAHTTPGAASPKQILHRAGAARPKPPAFANAKPIWDIPVGAQGAGAGTHSGAGSLGNGSGSGNGAGGAGSGNGAVAAAEPCGYVEFSDPHGSRYDPDARGFWVDIRMSVRFPDGHFESVLLDYPWFYQNEASNPWSDRNVSNPNFPTTFQPPPSDKRANEPALVQYVIAHTEARGYTLLKDCPASH